MSITIAVINHKGGVGKTTTAVNLAAGLTRHGKRVLLVDLDPQGNATYGLGVDFVPGESPSISQILSDPETPLESVMLDTNEEKLKVVPADIRLAHTAVQLNSAVFRETRLSKALSAASDFDYIIIDAQPTLDLLPVNAIYAADRLLIPTELTGYALCGLSDLMSTMKVTKNGGDYDYRILLTKVTGHGEDRQFHAIKYLESFADRILKSRIRHNEAIPRSQIETEEVEPAPVILQKSYSRGAQDYRALVKEILELWPA
ncbi:MAG: ParA family protein [Fimbriimonadaceae bacterium]|jgi:chromosome partitioning protein|nr:ParA family protein [Fimbriimonadaceae bacterium]